MNLDNDKLDATRLTRPPDSGRRARRLRYISLAALATAALAGCGSAHPTGPAAVPATTRTGAGPATATVPPGVASPSPSHASSSPSRTSPGSTHAASKPATASPSKSASGSGGSGGSSVSASCVTSAAKGSCGPYRYAQIEGTSNDPTVNEDVWNPIGGWHQTLYANNPGDWSVVANLPSGNTAVVSYPSSGSNYNERALSSFSVLTSSFSEKMNANNGTSAWAAYDVWFNNWGNEVMIQHDFANNGACPTLATATFGGSNGVPSQQWNLCKYGTELIWKLPYSEHAGRVDILAMTKWLVNNNGYLPQNSKLTAIGYGWELCSTGGQSETFHLSSYSISAH